VGLDRNLALQGLMLSFRTTYSNLGTWSVVQTCSNSVGNV